MLYPRLSDWIQPAHLEQSARTDYHARMAASPARMLVLDDFLTPPRYRDLQTLLREAGDLRPIYALNRHGGARVEREDWLAADASQRFYHHLELAGPRPGHELSPAYLTHISLLDALPTRPFLDYFQDLAGAPLNGITQVNAKAIGAGQFLHPHSDAEPGRRCCAVLYLNDDWQGAYGGYFALYRDGVEVDRVAPLGNRLLLFLPDSGYLHAVTPLSPEAGAWRRWNYTFWMTGPA